MNVRLMLSSLFLCLAFAGTGEVIQFYEGNNFRRQEEDSAASDARLTLYNGPVNGDFSLLCVFGGNETGKRRNKSKKGVKTAQDTEFTLGDYRIILHPEKYESIDGPETRTNLSLLLHDSLISTKRIDRFSTLSEGTKVRIRQRDHQLFIEAGKSTLKPILEASIADTPLSGISLLPGGDINERIRFLSLTYDESLQNRIQTPYTAGELTEYFLRSTDPMEGFWKVFDREMDEKLLKMGGAYTIAIIRSGNGYDMIYMDGAQTNGDNWTPGLLKGRLTATEAEGVYDTEWIDSMFGILSREIRATLSLPALTITFPYQDSRLRLHKMQTKQ